MVNQVALVGKIIAFDKQGSTYSFLLEIERPTKNEVGQVTYIQVYCVAWRGLVESVQRYYKIGDIVSVSGRLDVGDDRTLHVIAEMTHILHRGQLKKDIALEHVD